MRAINHHVDRATDEAPTRKRSAVQLGLGLTQKCGWGGKRRGAGRPRRQDRAGVPHRKRPALAARHPVHVTLRMRGHVWNLRSRRSFAVIEKAFEVTGDRHDFRIAHFSVQGNHLHLIVEASSHVALRAGIKAVTVRIAKGLNRLMGCRGAVFSDRYHAHALRTPREVRHALAYVLLNHRSHLARTGEPLIAAWIDPYSSGSAFDGWARGNAAPAPARTNTIPGLIAGAAVTAAARTWLLTVGWRRHGLIRTDELPAVRPPRGR